MKKDENIKIGSLVQSVAGHDKENFFLVVKKEGSWVWLCDGKRRKATDGKKKNIKHIAATGKVCERLGENPSLINNTSVRRAISELLK